MPCYSPLKGFKDRHSGGIVFKRSVSAYEPMEVGCGQCLYCRLDWCFMWMVRIIHESRLYETGAGNCFATLTYRDRFQCDDEQLAAGYHIPDDWSLSKLHMQLFFKRLRKRRADKIKYFYVGEYGGICCHGLATSRQVAEDNGLAMCEFCKVGRPHYHICLLNCSFSDLKSIGQKNGVTYFTSAELESIWKYGNVQVGELSAQTAGYAARYHMKKVTGLAAPDHYTICDPDGVVQMVMPEFVLMSRGHTCRKHRGLPYQVDCDKCSRGIGYDWLTKFAGDVFPSDEVPLPGGRLVKRVPRYYDEYAKEHFPEMFEQIQNLRKEFRDAHGDEYTPERLFDKYCVKKAQVRLLKREL